MSDRRYIVLDRDRISYCVHLPDRRWDRLGANAEAKRMDQEHPECAPHYVYLIEVVR